MPKIKVRSKQQVTEKEPVQSNLVKLVLENKMPQTLANIMEAWKLAGNDWLTYMELGLKLNSINKEVEFDSNAIKALIFMEYMAERKDYEPYCVRRYKLTKKGLKAVGMKEEQSLPEKGNAKPKKDLRTMRDCTKCQGSGMSPSGSGICDICKGEGELLALETKLVIDPVTNKRSTPVVTARRQIRRK